MAETNTNRGRLSYISPFIKQCFVTSGAALTMTGHGTTMGFPSALLTQLRETHFIELDDSSTSWIVSAIGFGLVCGLIVVPLVINRYGRKLIHLTSAIIVTLGWIIICSATTTTTLIIGRYIQGVANGVTSIIAPILVGEYTSPKNRGAFLATLSTSLFIGIFLVHATGSFISWQTSSIICGLISFISIFIILLSPESPVYLAKKGKYDKCKNNFHWLKGNKENDELDEMLKISMLEEEYESQNKQKSGFVNWIKETIDKINLTLKKRAFYRPIIIMLHLHAVNLWCGGTLYDSFATDIMHVTVGSNANIPLIIFSVDLQAIFTNMLCIFFIKKFKRKVVLICCASFNVTVHLMIAGYSYLKMNALLSFDYPAIGIILSHLELASINTGCISLPNIIAGEIFPFEYKGIGGMISLMFFSVNLIITLKIAPYLFSTIGLPGVYSILAFLVFYSLIVLIFIIPETKDRTLQDIENELKYKKSIVKRKMDLKLLDS
ncbi:facilitated trehalose transporter Tret1-like [Aphomia sociella]